jgi:hypothetical protein
MCIMSLCTKFHVSVTSVQLLITVKPKAKLKNFVWRHVIILHAHFEYLLSYIISGPYTVQSHLTVPRGGHVITDCEE